MCTLNRSPLLRWNNVSQESCSFPALITSGEITCHFIALRIACQLGMWLLIVRFFPSTNVSIDQIKSIPTSFATLSLPLDETALTVIPVSASVPQTLSAVAFVPLEARSCYFRARFCSLQVSVHLHKSAPHAAISQPLGDGRRSSILSPNRHTTRCGQQTGRTAVQVSGDSRCAHPTAGSAFPLCARRRNLRPLVTRGNALRVCVLRHRNAPPAPASPPAPSLYWTRATKVEV